MSTANSARRVPHNTSSELRAPGGAEYLDAACFDEIQPAAWLAFNENNLMAFEVLPWNTRDEGFEFLIG